MLYGIEVAVNGQRLHVLCWAVWREVAFLRTLAGGLKEFLYCTTSHLRLKSVLVFSDAVPNSAAATLSGSKNANPLPNTKGKATI